MRLIIAGGRDQIFGNPEINALFLLHKKHNISLVISGCAAGVDTCGEMWAKMQGIPVLRMPADWKKHGRSAGYKRNELMAEEATAAAIFPGGRGTSHMFNIAVAKKLTIFDFRPGGNAFKRAIKYGLNLGDSPEPEQEAIF